MTQKLYIYIYIKDIYLLSQQSRLHSDCSMHIGGPFIVKVENVPDDIQLNSNLVEP